MVQKLLTEARLKISELEGIAFGAGPGSFTGLRIACGLAQGLALGAGLKVVGVSTLEAMAEVARLRYGAVRVVAALDARMHEVYLAAYEHDGTRWREIIEASAPTQDSQLIPSSRHDSDTRLPRATTTLHRARRRSARSLCRASPRTKRPRRATLRRFTFASAWP